VSGPQNYINHVVLVLDGSFSITPHRKALIQVADGQIEYLARRSQELDQETRVSVYRFSDDVECLVYDKDVLRLPSIRTLFTVGGNTALIDATLKGLDDLEQTATLYGDHAFLQFVLTDGEENRSRHRPAALRDRLGRLPENWTVGVLVPDQRGVHEAKQFGFPAQNISVWDTTSTAGVREVGETIKEATEGFLRGRSQGVRGTRSLFSTGVDAVNTATVRGHLEPMRPRDYEIFPVQFDVPIKPYVESRGMAPYVPGKAFYQLTKREEIQPGKQIIIREKATGKFYTGPEARQILGLPDQHVKATPTPNPDYDIFVQSTSLNRKLVAGTDVLVLTR
jgi:hypothetical protein